MKRYDSLIFYIKTACIILYGTAILFSIILLIEKYINWLVFIFFIIIWTINLFLILGLNNALERIRLIEWNLGNLGKKINIKKDAKEHINKNVINLCENCNNIVLSEDEYCPYCDKKLK